MRRRRRFKPKVQWLPNTGTDLKAAINDRENSSAFITFQGLTFGPTNPTTVIEVPLILDQNPAAASPAAGMAAFQLRALDDETTLSYRLRRIYGSLYVGVTAPSATAGSAPAALLIEAGIIVRRVDPETGVALASGVADTDPGNLENNGDPWLWRRNWILTPILNILTAGTSTLIPAPDAGDDFAEIANALPRTNIAFQGAHQVPTVDIRSQRRISSEERLFLDIGVTKAPSSVPPQQSQTADLHVYFPYRALASLSVAGTNRRNASR